MKILKLFLTVTLLVFLFSECRYSFIVPEDIPVIDPNDPDAKQVSFKNDILPIFTNGNNCTACHNTGGTPPDLSAGKAFAAINSTRYINTDAPAESKIYHYIEPGTGTHARKKYTPAQAALVLGWIQQGAKDN